MSRLATLLLVAFLYVLCGKLGLLLAFVNPSTTAVWPPAGFALAIFLLYGYSLWPGVFIGALVVNFLTTGNVLTSFCIAGGNTLQGIAAAYLIQKFAQGKEFYDHPYDVFKFAVSTGIATTLSATAGTATLILGGLAAFNDFGSIWLTWWLGDAGGILVLSPLLILLAQKAKRFSWDALKMGEAFLAFLLLGAATWLIYSGVPETSKMLYPMRFAITPIILWTTFRFTPRETAFAVVYLGVMAVWGTSRGHGPFALQGAPNDSLLLLQLYLGTISVMGLAVAAVVAERRRALRSSEARFQRLIHSNVIGIIETDENGFIQSANAAFLNLIGYTSNELEKGLLNTHNMTPQEYQAQESWASEQLRIRGSYPALEKDFFHRDGHRIPVLIGAVRLDRLPPRSISFVIDATQRRLAMQALRRAYDEIEVRVDERTKELSELAAELAKEIERRKVAEEDLRNQSLTDPLTGLYNRRGFLLLAEQQWKQALREGRDLLFFFADVDGLKPINDQLGHAMGDEAIMQAAEALTHTFRRSDILGRIGGDEFAVVAMEVPPADKPLYFERLGSHLAELNASKRFPFTLSLSLGVARFDCDETTTISELMRMADEDLYLNKSSHAMHHPRT